MIEQAVGAAVDVAAAHGLRAEPEVLKDGSNAVVRLGPVVARVATETARLRAGVRAWLARDLRVARHLAGTAVPTTRPAAELPPGPHERDGFFLTFWQYEPHVVAPMEPRSFAHALASLHEGLDGLDLSDARGPDGDLAVMLAQVAVPDRLREQAEVLAAHVRSFPSRPLHGDAHPGNVLVTPSGPKWNDFEDAWQGPLGWDLACALNSSRIDGWAVLEAYPGPVSMAEVDACVKYRRVFGVVWQLFRALTDPARQDEANLRLAQWLRQKPSRY